MVEIIYIYIYIIGTNGGNSIAVNDKLHVPQPGQAGNNICGVSILHSLKDYCICIS